MSTVVKNIVGVVPERQRSIFAQQMSTRVQCALVVAQRQAELKQAQGRLHLADDAILNMIQLVIGERPDTSGLKYDIQTGEIYVEMAGGE